MYTHGESREAVSALVQARDGSGVLRLSEREYYRHSPHVLVPHGCLSRSRSRYSRCAPAVAHTSQVAVTFGVGFSDDNPPRGCGETPGGGKKRRAGDHGWQASPGDFARWRRWSDSDTPIRTAGAHLFPVGQPLSCARARAPGQGGSHRWGGLGLLSGHPAARNSAHL